MRPIISVAVDDSGFELWSCATVAGLSGSGPRQRDFSHSAMARSVSQSNRDHYGTHAHTRTRPG
jgi:hypothetical protein